MKVLVCYKNIINIPKAAFEMLTDADAERLFLPVMKSDEMRMFLKKNNIDTVLSSEISVLSKCDVGGVSKIYLAADYCSRENLQKTECDLYIIPSKELMFEFVNSGAKDKKVFAGILPVRKIYKEITDKKSACEKIGIDAERPVFTVFTKGTARTEVKNTVEAIVRLCPDCQTIVASKGDEKNTLSAMFSDKKDVFVVDEKNFESLCLSAADCVFSVADAEILTQVVLLRKPLLLMHSGSKNLRENASFFDKRGIGFKGKTASDNASYASRLLSSKRLSANMISAQERFIPENEKNFSSFVEKLLYNSESE